MTALLTALLCPSLVGQNAVAGRNAGDEEPPPPPPISDAQFRMAEYQRLQHRIKSLAQKNAWVGVERAYLEMIDTGVMPEFDDYLWGAHSARAQGDITSARKRLRRCNRIKEVREVIDWLAELDATYGPITLKGDPGVVELTAKALPFDPIKAKSIEFAQARVAETGSFDGLLPAGAYTFGPFSVDVAPGVLGETIDVRSDDHMRTEERRLAKERRAAKKKK